MVSDDHRPVGEDPVVQRLGASRAADLRAELEAHDLLVIDRTAWESLVSKAEGYRRMAALVEADPDDRSTSS